MDSLGRHNLKEMRKRVRRYTNLVMDVIGSPGEETVSALVGDEEINDLLNSNLVQRWTEVVEIEPLHFTDTTLIQTTQGRVEYPLPMDCLSVRILSLYDQIKNEWYPLIFSDGEEETEDAYGYPTYKVRLDYLILHSDPGYNRLKLEYVKLPLPLRMDDQVLETTLARVLQDIIIIDSAVELVSTRLGVDPIPIMTILKEREKRFRTAIAMMVDPPFRQIRAERREWRNG